MASLALRNLFHDKIRLAATVIMGLRVDAFILDPSQQTPACRGRFRAQKV
jgi:hypothetical protein